MPQLMVSSFMNNDSNQSLIDSSPEFQHHLNDALPTAKHREEVPHSVIGLTLVIGFVFMLCIDQCMNQHSSTTYSSMPTSGQCSQVMIVSDNS